MSSSPTSLFIAFVAVCLRSNVRIYFVFFSPGSVHRARLRTIAPSVPMSIKSSSADCALEILFKMFICSLASTCFNKILLIRIFLLKIFLHRQLFFLRSCRTSNCFSANKTFLKHSNKRACSFLRWGCQQETR